MELLSPLDGLEPTRPALPHYAQFALLVTALAPEIGYDNAATMPNMPTIWASLEGIRARTRLVDAATFACGKP